MQLAVVFKRLYKGLFLGLVNVALMNCYTAHREAKKRAGQKVMDHAKFLQKLQPQLLGITSDDFGATVSCSSSYLYWAG